MVPVKIKDTWKNWTKKQSGEWLNDHCKTAHQALYFFFLEDSEVRMLCIEKIKLIEDAATGSASSCLQAFLLKYHSLWLINK
jgi:trans-2,3-dihydro-3-hydroxyanthranilate isomerase